MDLNTQVKFASIYSNFSNEAHTCSDIGTLIELIRFNKHTISNEAKRTLLQIPLVVLSTQVNLKNETEWAVKNSDYFSGNCPNNSYQSIFASKDFNLDTMVTFLKDIMSDDQKLNSDF
ncbi:hypothetical protein K413DRAFT_4656 [Clostridium sp. ASBs410]|nr:hypothetical protein K413DRAFT_4656 [Clostridium sp. ASBs410]